VCRTLLNKSNGSRNALRCCWPFNRRDKRGTLAHPYAWDNPRVDRSARLSTSYGWRFPGVAHIQRAPGHPNVRPQEQVQMARIR
jgi:hypothetical protein